MKKRQIAADTTVIVTTYNKPDYLRLSLQGLKAQKVLPAEVIVADDGSGEETRQLIEHMQRDFPIPLVHSWIPDEGFRLSKSRNIAIAKAHGDYIILIDGDIVVSPKFVADHIKLRERGFFINGDRARLTQQATRRAISSGRIHFTLFTPGLHRPLKMIRLSWLHHFIQGATGRRKIRGCHMAFWRDDLIKVNGFEENIVGWGSEDTDLVARLYNAGVQRRNIKGIAICIHLWHTHEQEIYQHTDENRRIANQSAASGRIRAEVGLDQYITTDK